MPREIYDSMKAREYLENAATTGNSIVDIVSWGYYSEIKVVRIRWVGHENGEGPVIQQSAGVYIP